MGKKIICYIQAFDCKDTIAASMQSILEQTYGNWLCFVLSNGNGTNGSIDVIKGFAARDKRFIVLNKKYNSVDMYIPMLYHLAGRFPDSYICSLDADDVYKSDFFERAISLAQMHRLDIVACGTEIVLKKRPGSRKETPLGKREIEENLIIKEEGFTNKFPIYKPYFNEMWGKLYDTNLFGEKYDEPYADRNFFRRFLPDTLFTLDNLSRCTAIGILSGTSHKFYQFEQRNATNATVMANVVAASQKRKKISFRRKRGRYFSVFDTYETIISFLRSHGEITGELHEYMQAVLFGWFGDFYTRTLLLTTDEARLAGHIGRLVFHPKFDEIMRYRDGGKYNNLKNYEKRKDYCELLKYTLICQEVIRNRERGRNSHKRVMLRCTLRTRRKIEKIVAKLDDTIQILSQLQSKGE